MRGLDPRIHEAARLTDHYGFQGCPSSWIAGAQASEATPSFGRLCPAMTTERTRPDADNGKAAMDIKDVVMRGLDPRIHEATQRANRYGFPERPSSWMAGAQASEATPSFGRLCPAMTSDGAVSAMTTERAAPEGARP